MNEDENDRIADISNELEKIKEKFMKTTIEFRDDILFVKQELDKLIDK